jgi:hypothetical protein
MTMPLERPTAIPAGQQLPLPLGPPVVPAPTLRPHEVWAGLPLRTRTQVREAVLVVVREVLRAANRR